MTENLFFDRISDKQLVFILSQLVQGIIKCYFLKIAINRFFAKHIFKPFDRPYLMNEVTVRSFNRLKHSLCNTEHTMARQRFPRGRFPN